MIIKKKSLIASFTSSIKVGVILGLIGLMFISTSDAEARQTGVSFQVFYDELLPYGDWIHDPVHGYVWVPYAEPDFQPYASNGYWVMSNYGNTWVSNYEWGWAPFHYGRWYFDDYLGWAWVPGYEWGPAWVSWRTGGGYYGWAPLMPGISIRLAINIPSHYWIFVPGRRLISRHVYNYYIPRNNVYRIYNQTTVINNTYVQNNRTYISGPERREIERVTRRSVPVYRVNDSNRPGRASLSRNTLQVYRPEIRQADDNSRRTQAKPSRVVSAREHKKITADRNSSRGNLSPARTRTAPSNARINNSRATENVQERNNVQEGNPARRKVAAPARNSSRINEANSRTQPSVNQRVTPSNRSNQVRRPSTQQPSVKANQKRKEQSPAVQPSPRVRQENSAPRQVRPANQATQRKSTVQRDRTSPQVRSQPAQRNRSTPNVSSKSTREKSSGNASRSNNQSRRSSRGNN